MNKQVRTARFKVVIRSGKRVPFNVSVVSFVKRNGVYMIVDDATLDVKDVAKRIECLIRDWFKADEPDLFNEGRNG